MEVDGPTLLLHGASLNRLRAPGGTAERGRCGESVPDVLSAPVQLLDGPWLFTPHPPPGPRPDRLA